MTGKRRLERRPRGPQLGIPPGQGLPPGPGVGPRPGIGPPITIARQPTRRELRRQRQQRQRRRLGAGGIAIIAAVVAVLAVGIGVGVQRATSKSGPPPRTQRTLLVQIRGAGNVAVGSALLAYDSKTTSAAEILIPGTVISEVPGAGSLQFSQALTLRDGIDRARSALADLMGVQVDGSWVVSEPALAALVNRLGGITVNVNTTVTKRLARGGSVVLLNPGSQRLDGTHAVAYATYLASSEPPLAILPRLQGVLDGVMAALPRAANDIASLIGGRGSLTAGTTRTAVATFLAGFAVQDAAGKARPTDLPVDPIDVPVSSQSRLPYRIDAAQLQQLDSTVLAASIPSGTFGSRRFIVENGVGRPGLGASVADRLTSAGFRFVGDRNAPHFGYSKSVVLIFSATQQAVSLGDQVAQILGLPQSDVKLSTLDQSIADVVIIVGADYRA